MSEFTDFLLTCIAEDEAAARDALEHGEGTPEPEPWLAVGWPASEHPGPVVLVDPHRFLAECEAKRAIVAEHPDYGGYGESCATCAESAEDLTPWPCPTLRALALPYADHPDYRDEWAVS